MSMVPPVRVTAPTPLAKVMLLAFRMVLAVIVPLLVVAATIFRSSALVGFAMRVPAPPVASVFQKLLVPFHAPVIWENPAVCR
jgi:hypothetical protein